MVGLFLIALIAVFWYLATRTEHSTSCDCYECTGWDELRKKRNAD